MRKAVSHIAKLEKVVKLEMEGKMVELKKVFSEGQDLSFPHWKLFSFHAEQTAIC